MLRPHKPKGAMSDFKCLRILMVIAVPVWDEALDQEPIHLDMRREWRNIVEGIERKPIPVCLERLPMPTERDLDDALAQAVNEAPYTIVHVLGHGARGYLALDDGVGRVHMVDAKTLGETFTKRGVQLVVLNTCHSAEARMGDFSVADALIEAGVPAVIGMSREIHDLSAIRLADVLYQRLASGYTVNGAIEEVRKSFRHDPQLKGLDADVPLVLGNGDLLLCQGAGIPGIFANYPTNNLPRNAYFFGRSKKLVSIAETLMDSSVRGVAINGPGGIGKSALAIEAAWRNASRFQALIWVEATQNSSLQLEKLHDEIRRLLYIKDCADILEAINSHPCLLILDNLHWLKHEDWWRIEEFLLKLDPACSKFLLIYRSHWDGLAGIDGLSEIVLDDLDLKNSIALLRAEGKLKGVTRLIDGDEQKLKELAKVCHYHPYFLRLGAARAAKQPLDQLSLELAGLKGEFQDWTKRFLEGQVELIGNDGKNLLPRLSVFSSQFSRDDVCAVCGQGIDVDAALLDLVNASLLIYSNDKKSYSLHDLTKAYAIQFLSNSEVTYLGNKHALYFLDQAMRAFSSTTAYEAVECLHMIKVKLEDWMDGQLWYEKHENWLGVIFYADAISESLRKSGYWNERLEILKKAVYAAEKADDKSHLPRMAFNLSVAYKDVGDHEIAEHYCKDSLKAFEDIGDQSGISNCLTFLGTLAVSKGDYEAAWDYCKRSHKILEILGDKARISESLFNLGFLAERLGNHKDSQLFIIKSLEIFKTLDDKTKLSEYLLKIGGIAQNQGDYKIAQQYYEESLKNAKLLSDKSVVSRSLYQLGCLAFNQGDYKASRLYYEESLAVDVKSGDKQWIAKTLHQLGILAQCQDDYVIAQRRFEDSLRIKEALGDKIGIARSLHQLGTLAHMQRKYELAQHYYEDSLEIAEASQDLAGIGYCFRALGHIAFDQGHCNEAMDKYKIALAIFRRVKDMKGVAGVLNQLGVLAQSQKDYALARSYHEDSLKIEERLGDKAGIALSLFNLAIAEENERNLTKALELVIKAEKLFLELGTSRSRVEKARSIRIKLEKMLQS